MIFVSLLLFSVLQFTTPNSVHSQPSPPPTRPYVYVLVNSTIRDSLSSALSTYKQDLENDGFSVEIPQDFGNNATAIREFLQNETETNEIAGILLVGDIPYAKFEESSAGYYYCRQCDMYYMDLDGNWTDSGSWILNGTKTVNWTYNPNGIFDMHTSETGDLRPEIWAGRLYASTVTGLFNCAEGELLINYFNKDHLYRNGSLTLPKRSLGYMDDDCVSKLPEVNSSLHMVYGNETTLVTDFATTNATDYINRLNDTLGYEWVHLSAHGNYHLHSFDIPPPQNFSHVYSENISSIDPHAFFYDLESCNTADYTYQDYIGGAYTFANTYGLSVVYGIWNYISYFWESLAEGNCVGQAFKEHSEKVGLGWLRDSIILGDPTLRPHLNDLTVLAEDQNGKNLTTGDVYIDGLYQGRTNSSLIVPMGTHEVFVTDFWESNNTGYRYFFDYWFEDNSTDNPKNMTVAEDTTVTAKFNKTWCEPVSLPNWSFEEINASVCDAANWTSNKYVTGNDGGWRELRSNVNNDSIVDGGDMIIIGNALWSDPVDPRYDLNGDNNIDGGDLTTCGNDLWKSWANEDAFRLDGNHSWYTDAGGNYTMWQELNDSAALEAVAGQIVVFSFWFYPETVALDGSQNNARAEIYYEYDGGNNTVYGILICPRELGWWNAYVTASLPANITALKVTIHGTPDFKAWIDFAQLRYIE